MWGVEILNMIKRPLKRNIWERLAILLGILCIAGALTLTIAYGFTIGNALTLCIAAVLIGLGLWIRKMPRWVQRGITVVISIGLVFFIAITSIVIRYGATNTATFTEDGVLVLGCGIRGEDVLPTLASRLDKCVEYLQQNPNVPVIVSGGQGPKEDIPEAVAMKRYLISKGIASEQIVVEDRSRNTIENLANSKPLLDSLFADRAYTVAIITSDYHAYRVTQAAEDAGLSARMYNAPVKWYLRPSAYSREALSICKFQVTKNAFQSVLEGF